MAVANNAPKSPEELLHGSLAASLLTQQEVDEQRALLDASSTAKSVAQRLVAEGNLTPYQASILLKGKQKSLLLGEYVVSEPIGAGGMGQVFKAVHRRMKRTVALKLLPAEATKSTESVRRFQREVEAAAKLHHPHIVTAFDAGEAFGRHYLVMEYVPGSDLSSLVKSSGPVAVPAAVNYVLQAAQGLAYAHAQGVVHRDVKPGNLLLSQEGVVKVLDLGLAHIEEKNTISGETHDITHTGQVMGSVDFMAPEQAEDIRRADYRVDIYSLGCTLYYLLTSRPPYGGDTVVQRILAHREMPPPSLRSLRSDVPRELDELFHRMIAKRPEGRCAGMEEVIESLKQLEGKWLAGAEAPTADQLLTKRNVLPPPIAVSGTAGAAPATPRNSGIGSDSHYPPPIPAAPLVSLSGESHSNHISEITSPIPGSKASKYGKTQSGKRSERTFLMLAGVGGGAMLLLAAVFLAVMFNLFGARESENGKALAKSNPPKENVDLENNDSISTTSTIGNGEASEPEAPLEAEPKDFSLTIRKIGMPRPVSVQDPEQAVAMLLNVDPIIVIGTRYFLPRFNEWKLEEEKKPLGERKTRQLLNGAYEPPFFKECITEAKLDGFVPASMNFTWNDFHDQFFKRGAITQSDASLKVSWQGKEETYWDPADVITLCHQIMNNENPVLLIPSARPTWNSVNGGGLGGGIGGGTQGGGVF